MYDTKDLLNAIKQSAVDAVEALKPVNIAFGTVTNVSPLEIQVEQKLVLQNEQLILSRNVTKHTVLITTNVDTDTQDIEYDFSHNHSISLDCSTYDSHSHNIQGTISDKTLKQSKSHKHTINKTFDVTINNELKKGEHVILLRVQRGQQYLVLDRIGG